MNRRIGRSVAMALLLAVAACGSDDNPTGPSATVNGSLTATVDGVTYTAVAVTAVRSGGGPVIIAVGASDIAGVGLGLGFADNGPGTYDMSSMSTVATGNLIEGGSVWSASFSQGSGTIVITALDANHVAGTFNFTATLSSGTGAASRTVTNGSFDVDF